MAGAVVRIIDNTVHVVAYGTDLLAPLVATATTARDETVAARNAVQPIITDLALGGASKLSAIGADLLSGSSSIALVAANMAAILVVPDQVTAAQTARAGAEAAATSVITTLGTITKSQYASTIGRPIDAVFVGTTSAASSTVVIATPIPSGKSARRRLRVRSRQIGTLSLRVFTLSGSTFTQASSLAIDVATGDQIIELPDNFGAAGQYFGFYGASLVNTATATADGTGFYSRTGDQTTVNMGGIVTTTQLQIAFDFFDTVPDVASGTAVAKADAKAAYAANAVAPYDLHPRTKAVQAAAITAGSPMSARRLSRHDRLMERLSAAGILSRLTALYLIGDTEAQWLINHVTPGANDLKKTGNVNFVANQQVTGSSATNNYDTSIPLSALVKDNFSMGLWTLARTASATLYDMGAVDGANGVTLASNVDNGVAAMPRVRAQGGEVSLSTDYQEFFRRTVTANPPEWISLTRSASDKFTVRHNGVTVTDIVNTSVTTTSSNTIRIASGLSPVGMAYVGQSLTEDQARILAAATQDYYRCVRYGDPMIYPIGKGPALVRADVIVYGLSMGAICCAYAAKSQGYSVALVGDWQDSTIWDLGGMPVNGLTLTDFRNGATFSGLYREIQYWASRRGLASNTDLQPATLLAGVCAMLDPTRADTIMPGLDIPVYMTGGVTEVRKEDVEMSFIRTRDGRTFSGRYFAEGSYDGDLVAFTPGLPVQHGLEAAGTGKESGAGYRTDHENTSIDAYVTAGNPASGLLPGVIADPGLTAGVADSAYQTSNFRFTGQQRPARRVPISSLPPAGYNALNHEALARRIAANPSIATLDSIFKIDGVDGTWDFNNGLNAAGSFSSDAPASGVTYPTAALSVYKRRTQHWDYVRSYQMGLLYFLGYSGDSRIPTTLVDSAKVTWGLDAQSHLDPAEGKPMYWPKRMYQREPYTMLKNIGYVFDANDLSAAAGTVPRSIKTISSASYRVDFHYKRLISIGGIIYKQGQVDGATQSSGAGSVSPNNAPMPFEAFVPDKAVCINMVSIYAPSMTKMAWSEARMEPALSQAGESLGFAIAQALKSGGIPIQDVDYPTLRALILAQPRTVVPPLPQVN